MYENGESKVKKMLLMILKGIIFKIRREESEEGEMKKSFFA